MKEQAMSHVVLSEEQTQIVLAGCPLEVRDTSGTLVGHVEPIGFTAEEITEARRSAASPGPWYSGDAVRKCLAALEESERREGRLDSRRLQEILTQFRSQAN
jgi:hypothetical protein